jgi:hypothetical protein
MRRPPSRASNSARATGIGKNAHKNCPAKWIRVFAPVGHAIAHHPLRHTLGREHLTLLIFRRRMDEPPPAASVVPPAARPTGRQGGCRKWRSGGKLFCTPARLRASSLPRIGHAAPMLRATRPPRRRRPNPPQPTSNPRRDIKNAIQPRNTPLPPNKTNPTSPDVLVLYCPTPTTPPAPSPTSSPSPWYNPSPRTIRSNPNPIPPEERP